MAHIAGIDLGGTKIEGIILDEQRPDEPLCRLRIPTERERGYEHILSQISRLCGLLSNAAGVPFPARAGMGAPGAIDPLTLTVKGANTQCLNGKKLREDVRHVTGVDFVIVNDANCFALAEATRGAARGSETVFGVILGTGVGGGLVVDGRVLNGCHGIAGEWGQLVLDADSELVSNYGTRGTVEAILSGPGLEQFYTLRSGRTLPLKDIAQRARAGGDPAAALTLTHLVRYFAQGIAMIINVFDPHAVVIGGGVGNLDELYSENLLAEVAKHVFNPRLHTKFLRPALGDSAGVFGAAMLVCRRET
ncbi:MAG: ROK family protein [Verrucomicrobiales bacterium]|jgi:predicted NBD/HSP70 family sugar kinase|nr:ROK family protein [Verrucomicrobiales bacterium]